MKETKTCLGQSEAEVDHLKPMVKALEEKISLKSKGKLGFANALVEVLQKLANVEAWEKVVAHEVLESYNLFEDCKDWKITFLKLAFLEGMEETQKRVI